MKQKIFLALAAVFILIQFIRIDKINPPVATEQDYLTATPPPAEIAKLIKVACYDCHSNETAYPWYTNIAPVSWWIENHIEHGREHLNFSVWTSYSEKKASHKLEECYEVLEQKEMPMLSYMVAHPDAWISAEERAALVNWFKEAEK